MTTITIRSPGDAPSGYKPTFTPPTAGQVLVPSALALGSIALILVGGAISAGGSFLGAPMGAAAIGSAFLAMNVYSKTDSDGLFLNLIPIALVSVTAALCWLMAILMPFAIIAAALSIFVSGGVGSLSATFLPLSIFLIITGGAALFAMKSA